MERMLQGPIPRHSPCVGVCTLDPASGWCLGCGRNTDEIARWSTMDEAQQLDCWSKLPRRLATLSVQAHLLPWAVDHITKWVGTTLAAERGTWVTGVPGAVAEFPCGPEHNVEVVRDRDFVGGRTGKAVFRLNLHDKLRAFAFGQGAPIVLGIPKVRVPLAVAHTLTALGPDIGAVDIQDRSDQLFDFGLGRRSSRFCVRTGDPALGQALRNHCSSAWPNVLAAIGAMLLSHSPHRVVESALARIEVFTPIPAPGTTTPSGAHTHFLPQLLTAGEEVPAGLSLPDYALPVAIYYPAPATER